ncbi:hypothetical protein D3C84_795680 [compost metagenome]
MYGKEPVTVGVPLIVIVFAFQFATTPAGNPVIVPIPVAPVVVCVILIPAPKHILGFDDAVTVFVLTVIVPVAYALVELHPVKRIL